MRATFGFTLLLLLPIGMIAPGCGLPRAPAHPEDDPRFEPVEEPNPPGMDQDPPAPLALYPGDVVALEISGAETRRVPGLAVDERGMLHVPLAGDVQVAGLPLVQAERAIEGALRRYERGARVTIIITAAAGRQATVIGAVANPGRFEIVPGMRVADLLAEAGGPAPGDAEGGVPAPMADLYRARLVRAGQALPVSIATALTGDPRHNVRVRAGDHLYIPPQTYHLISVLGEVNAARVLPFAEGLRLSQVLAMAGGITRDANGGDIRIIRGRSENPRIYRAAIDHVASGDHPDPILAPGDVVFVGSSALADFRDVIGAITPIITLGSSTAIGVAAVQAASPGGAD